MREIDRLTIEEHGVPSLELMQAAARACFLEIEKRYSGKLSGTKVRVLCGPGNNGGDGAALGQLLSAAGARPKSSCLEVSRILTAMHEKTSSVSAKPRMTEPVT